MVKFIKAHLENHIYPDDDPFVKDGVGKCSWKNYGKNLSAVVMLVKTFLNVGEAVCWRRQKFKGMLVKFAGENFFVCWLKRTYNFIHIAIILFHLHHGAGGNFFTNIKTTDLSWKVKATIQHFHPWIWRKISMI